MPQTDRILYEALSEQYIEDRFINALKQATSNVISDLNAADRTRLFRIFAPSDLLTLDANAFVEECYKRLLDRAVDKEEQASCISAITSGMPCCAVIGEIISSEEFNSKFSIAVLQKERLLNQSDCITAEKTSLRTFNLPELLKLNAKQFIEKCYTQFLNRAPDEQSLASRLQAIAAGESYKTIIGEIIVSTEFNNKYTITLIQKGRATETSRVSDPSAEERRLAGKQRQDLSALLNLAPDAFVEECYKQLLNRAPDEDGKTSFLNAIASGMPYQAVIYSIIRSREFNRKFLIKDQYLYAQYYISYTVKKKFRIIDWIITVFTLPSILKRNNTEISIKEEKLLTWIEKISQKLDSHNEALIELQRQLRSITDLQEEEVRKSQNRFTELVDSQKGNITELQQNIRSLADAQKNITCEFQNRITELTDSQKNAIAELRQSIGNVKDTQQSAMDGLQQNLNALSTKIQENLQPQRDIPPELVINGVLDKESYLDEACGNGKLPESNYSDQEKFYYYLGNLFRGDFNDIKTAQNTYMPLVQKAIKNTGNLSFLDIGCGRGEFLDLLRENGITAEGVDVNAACARPAIARGHRVVIGDGMDVLQKREDSSLSGVSLFQIAEHLTFEYLFKLCRTASQKIAEGGCLLIETINPYCYSRLGNFAVDPSHITLPSPDSLKLMVELAGFSNTKIRFYSPVDRRTTTSFLPQCYEGFCLTTWK